MLTLGMYDASCVDWVVFSGLNQRLELSEMKRQQLEDEIMVVNREKVDITEQLNTVSSVRTLSGIKS